MCVVSAIGNQFQQTLPNQWYYPHILSSEVSRAEFDTLKRDMTELKELLKAAKKYDEATGQPECETEDKVALIKKLAAIVGVDMKEIFG
jgi:hypothetical protein